MDAHAPRRAELLADIQRAQDVRADARRDLAGGIIDRADWLDIRQRTEDGITKARREYDRPAGSLGASTPVYLRRSGAYVDAVDSPERAWTAT
jgi:hypothetical protein